MPDQGTYGPPVTYPTGGAWTSGNLFAGDWFDKLLGAWGNLQALKLQTRLQETYARQSATLNTVEGNSNIGAVPGDPRVAAEAGMFDVRSGFGLLLLLALLGLVVWLAARKR